MGRRLGGYEIVESIGTGGMAEVFLATHKGPASFEKQVVLKVIHPHLARDEHFVAMFLDEARLAARIHDPRVVQIFELGEHDGIYFMAMEYLDGESLASLIKAALRGRPPMSPHLVARVVAECAAGLHAAHEVRDADGQLLDVVHRDVSHANIAVLYSGVVKILDFGVAKARDSMSTTQVGERKGKYGYMAPEQILGGAVDRRSDVFALGIVLWEALARRRLFLADSEQSTLRRVLEGTPPEPSSIEAGVPRELDAIAMRALAKEPDKRFQTAEDMRVALEEFLRTSGVSTTAMDVTKYMYSAFPQRAQQKRAKLDTNPEGMAPMLAELTFETAAAAKVDAPTERMAAPVEGKRRVWTVAIAVIGLCAIAFAAGRASRSEQEETGRVPESPTPTLTPTPTPAVPVVVPVAKPAVTRSLADSLLDRADAAIVVGHVTEPAGDNALELVLDAENLEPTNPRTSDVRAHAVSALLAGAQALWEHGKQDSARNLYAEVLLFDPDNAVAKDRARVKVVAAAPRAVRPEEIAWLVSQVDLAIIERRLVAPAGNNALEYLLQLRAIDPTNDATRRLGVEVSAALTDAVAKQPDTATAEQLAAAARVASPEGAAGSGSGAGSADQLKKRDPVAAAEWVRRGSSDLASGSLAAARGDFQRAIGADPESHAALAGLGEVAFNESDFAAAVLASKSAVAMAPRATSYRMLLAKSYYKLLRYDDAIAQWKKVLELDDGNATAKTNIEMAERRLGH